MQEPAGGQLAELSPTTFKLTWSTGEALTITDSGAFLNSAVALPAADRASSAQGLLGSDSGQGNHFQLPGDSIIPRPLRDNELLGTFTDAWRLTSTNSLWGNDAMRFVCADADTGQTVSQATAPGKILSGEPGGILSDADRFGATFLGSLSDFASEATSGFTAKDVIDVIGLNSATAAMSYDGSTTGGVLKVRDGVHRGDIQLAGQIAGGSFHVTSHTRRIADRIVPMASG